MNSCISRFICKATAAKFVVSLLLLGLLLCTDMLAQDFWQQTNGPYGGTVRSIAINSSGLIFAGTAGTYSGIFRSNNNGDSWEPVNNGLTYPLIYSLCINSTGHIFAGDFGRGVYRSTDNGNSWTQVNTGLTGNYVQALAINSSGHIFAGTHGGVFRSENNGSSWTQVNTGLTNTDVQALAINSSGHIFAGTLDGGVFRSIDNGDSWMPVNNGLTIADVRCFAINSRGHIFAGTWLGGIFRSTDNGSSWKPINTGLSSYYVYSIVANSSGHIFASTVYGGVFRSIDNGDNWITVNAGLTNKVVHSSAINSNGYIFAGTEGSGVYRSVQSTLPFTATTSAATNVTSTSATLNGKVNPSSLSTVVKFEYGTTTTYGNEVTATQSPITDTSAVAVSAAITGLLPSTTYHFRVVAINSADTTYGADQSFITSGTAPTATTNAATSVAATSATLNGSINANGLNTTVKFQYGTSTSYGSEMAATPGSVTGTSAVAVSAAITDLLPNTTYHFRVVAINSADTTYGVDQSFITLGMAPTATTNAATSVAATSATLNGSVNANGLNTTVKFQYGTSTSYGSEMAATPGSVTGTSAVAVSAAITGLLPNTTYHFRVVAANSADTTHGANQIFITLGDVSAPQITHSPANAVSSGQSLNISVTATDNIGVQAATLYYRQGGATNFQSTPMYNSGGDNYTATIPANLVTERGLEYYLSVTDPSNNTAWYPATEAIAHPQVVRVRSENLTRAAQTPAMAYRMISVPIELEKPAPKDILEDDWGNYDDTQWRLLRYVNGEDKEYTVHSDFNNFSPGYGFWLITRHPQMLAVGAGLSYTTADSFNIALQPGWNQIGNPFAFTVNWSEVVKGSDVESKLVGYQGSLNEASGYDYTRTRLEPWEGYFVNNLGSSSTTIAIPPVAASGSLAKTETLLQTMQLQEHEWALQISAACDRYLDKDNYLGCLSDAADTWDYHDFSEAPFFDKQVSLYFPHPNWVTFPGRYTGDFRSVTSEGLAWDFEVKTNLANAEVKLRLAEIQNLSADWQIVLLDQESHVSIDLLKEKSYAFWSGAGETTRKFRLLVGPKSFIETNDMDLSGMPQEYMLSKNYPNPFNPATQLSYGLPGPCQVRISIYNTTGQEIRILAHGWQSGGRYSVSWDGKNDQGDQVASGVYLVRMEAGKFVAVRKVVLTK